MNKEFKQEYLEQNSYRNENLKTYMDVQFKKLEPIEDMYGKDAYDFTVSEIINYYKFLCVPSLEVLMVLNNQLTIYTRYAMTHHLVKDFQNHYEEIDNNILYECINRGLFENKIFTREQLKEVAFHVANPVEAYILYALFEGISGKGFSDLANLTKDNYEKGMVHLPSGKNLIISDELYYHMLDAAEEHTYYGYTKSGDIKEFKFKEGDKKIIKDMYNVYAYGAERDRVRVHNRIMKIVQIYGLTGLTAKGLNESGRIHMIKQFMEQDGIYDLREAIIKHRDEIEYRYGKITSVDRYIIKYKSFYER